jgi:hypothetical protein
MFVLYLVLRPYLERHHDLATVANPSKDVRDRFEAGRQALAVGSFRRARLLLEETQGMNAKAPGVLSAVEQHELRRLSRQADLLARLLPLSLQELLHQGLRINDDNEWQSLFADYQGRSVVFDDWVRRDSRGRPELANYTVADGKDTARLALEDLSLWQRVPLEPPRRVLFGARLRRMAREPGGVWVVRFEPESGVLLTDARAAAAICPAPLGADLEEVLRRQVEWERP